MKRLCYLLLVLASVSFAQSGKSQITKTVLITAESRLNIKGTSNISDFKCNYQTQKLNKKTQISYKSEGETIQFDKALLILENDGFDCGGRGINRDFHRLLQSDLYPTLSLNLKEVTLKPNQKNCADALVEIEIAGIKKSYFMKTTFEKKDQWHITGKLKLNIQDFALKAPTKMLGMIVVSDEIEIGFHLNVQEQYWKH